MVVRAVVAVSVGVPAHGLTAATTHRTPERPSQAKCGARSERSHTHTHTHMHVQPTTLSVTFRVAQTAHPYQRSHCNPPHRHLPPPSPNVSVRFVVLRSSSYGSDRPTTPLLVSWLLKA